MRHHRAWRRGCIELAHERIAAGGQRPDVDRGPGLARDHLLAVQRVAVELLGRRVLVVDDEPYLHVGGDAQFARHEPMFTKGQRELRFVGGMGNAHR